MTETSKHQSTQRFSNRVADYVKYRPQYPVELVSVLQQRTGLRPSHCVADIGSGTGILSKLFLEFGNTVLGIEPNRDMAAAAGKYLSRYERFDNREGTAESTGLTDASVDYIVAGQAFHWFDIEPTAREIRRILKPNGWCVLIWNDRRIDSTPFLRDYETFLLKWSIDYAEVSSHYQDPEAMNRVFDGDGWESVSLDNLQIFDFAGLRGRVLSSSYIPAADDPCHQPMLAALEELFERHQENGSVRMDYDTQIHFGHVK